MKTFKFIFLIVGTLGLLSSCQNFLDRPPLSSITPQEFFTSESQLSAYTVNMYGVFPTHQQWTFGTFGIDANTDNMASAGYSNEYVPGQWKVAGSGGDWEFSNIYQANYFLENVIPKWEKGQIAGDANLIKHDIGEMYMIRAYVYFTKLQDFGDFPIVKTTLPDNMDTLTNESKRAPCNEVARFIIADLDSAINMMETVSPDGGNKNRLSKNCALLLKSRVALYEATWLKYFAGTAFVPNGPGWPGASKTYNANYQYPAGSIDNEIAYFLNQSMDAAQQVADAVPLVPNNMTSREQTGLAFSQASDQNPYCQMFSAVDMSGFSEVLFWRSYSLGLGITHNVPNYEEGGNDDDGTTRGMVDCFLMSNGLPIYAQNSGYMGDDSAATTRINRDGRLWLFLKTPGQINVLYPNIIGAYATPIEPIPYLTGELDRKYTTGYAIRKGLNYNQDQCENGGGYTGSIVFRAVEAYLNYMEAEYLLNGSLDSRAQSYWTQIRQRAGVDPDFNKTIAATDMAKEALNDWGAYSAGQLIDPTLYNIRRERRCELWAEGLRAMDLHRWRAMDQMITTPYQIEGFKLWGPMQNWYKDSNGNSTLIYGIGDASNVSSPLVSMYLRPYQITQQELVYNGYRWDMAHYLEPIATENFLITSKGNDVTTSPIYQNPDWPITANMPPTE